jgi:hypothetical protein
VNTQLCTLASLCNGFDPSVVTCGQTGLVERLSVCSSGVASSVSDGRLTYSATAGQACLDALHQATACDSATYFAVAQACLSPSLLAPAVANGGTCLEDQDCLSSIGVVPGYQHHFAGCDIDYRDPTLLCSGTCSAGLHLGDRCDYSTLVCSEGQCAYTALPDAGEGYFCTAQLPLGAACDPNTPYLSACEVSTGYCGPSDGGYACLPRTATVGQPCDANACANYFPSNCECAGTTFCDIPDDGGVSTCANLLPGAVAVLPPNNGAVSCANGATYVTLVDGGSVTVCNAVQTALGGICNPYWGCGPGMYCDTAQAACAIQHLAGEACVVASPGCALGMVCVSSDGGTGVCGLGSAPGEACASGCEAFTDCGTLADGGAGCVARPTLGEPCSTSSSCVDGYCAGLGDGGSACAPLIAIGQPCDRAAVGPCADRGYCNALADGGAYCEANLCAD